MPHMSPATLRPVSLKCHPATPSQAARRLDVLVRRAASGALSFNFSLEGDMARIRLPPIRRSARKDGLWRHTCFEAFIADGAEAYYELNFAPSTEWAVYAFSGYRQGSSPVELPRDRPSPEIATRLTDYRLELGAVICLSGLPPPRNESRLRLALSAVVEEESGSLSYWALAHPSGKPDFHHPDGFALELAGVSPYL